MPRRSLLTPTERTSVLAFPTIDDEAIRHYTFTESDPPVIRQHRGAQNRLDSGLCVATERKPGKFSYSSCS
jgi:hypothetical protein